MKACTDLRSPLCGQPQPSTRQAMKQKIWQHEVILQIKVVQNSISCKKLTGQLSFFAIGVKLGGGKYLPCTGMGKVGSLQGRMLPKAPIVLKNALNKNCIKLNFQQKTQLPHVFISHWSGARGQQRFVIFNIIHGNWKLGSFSAERCQKYQLYSKKCFCQKLFKVKFPTKKHKGRISLSSLGAELGAA